MAPYALARTAGSCSTPRSSDCDEHYGAVAAGREKRGREETEKKRKRGDGELRYVGTPLQGVLCKTSRNSDFIEYCLLRVV